MAKYYGAVGYAVTEENPRGVWKETVRERFYRGDLTKNSRRLSTGDGVNDNVTITNEISLLCDPYAFENFHAIRYARFMGVPWKVTSVTVNWPRLILSLGDVYNGVTAQETENASETDTGGGQSDDAT